MASFVEMATLMVADKSAHRHFTGSEKAARSARGPPGGQN
jgi:hypothetical protein